MDKESNHNTVLIVDNVSHFFSQEMLFSNLSFKQKPGQVIAILGASGSGKTTLLRIIAGLTKQTGGVVRVFGHEHQHAREELGESKVVLPKITMVFQELKLFPNLTMRENCLLGTTSSGAHIDPKYVFKLQKKLDVEHLGERKPWNLSHGQKQRFAIIRSLATHPSLLLLDEPTSALDYRSRKKLIDVLNEEKKKNVAIICATHDWVFAATIADTFIILDNETPLITSSLSKIKRVKDSTETMLAYLKGVAS